MLSKNGTYSLPCFIAVSILLPSFFHTYTTFLSSVSVKSLQLLLDCVSAKVMSSRCTELRTSRSSLHEVSSSSNENKM